MAKRLRHHVLEGPEKEVVKVSWMPGKRLRLDFVSCGPSVVTQIFTKGTTTHLEVRYGTGAG